MAKKENGECLDRVGEGMSARGRLVKGQLGEAEIVGMCYWEVNLVRGRK